MLQRRKHCGPGLCFLESSHTNKSRFLFSLAHIWPSASLAIFYLGYLLGLEKSTRVLPFRCSPVALLVRPATWGEVGTFCLPLGWANMGFHQSWICWENILSFVVLNMALFYQPQGAFGHVWTRLCRAPLCVCGVCAPI